MTGKDAAAKMAILARLAFNAPVTLDQVSYEGIERITPDDIAYAKELGLSLKLVGSAERHRRRHRRARATRPSSTRGHPLAIGERRVQRRDDRVAGDHRDHPVRARARAARRPPPRCWAT